ncbi:ABC transporter ATP-binding protein [Paracholeplasma manati]|uniref:ABC transporter ATP-binding protein/permease n=1 Tax=Paracholeplasma manati TaxID=591373 RepID=A0ABT2Y6N6_9MOLU|nr:ABC transporter ATP-binding protein [Paracholeplasma manati]MCV2232400.1 ABC transporter ATP-binding protein/permease [Paracholeplasma manati]MDG0888014.1 ABC transporter ATP-binding protein [Paracholeplasma manati]
MLKLFKYFKWWYYPLIVLILGLTLIQVELDLNLIDYMREIITLVGKANITGESQTNAILNQGLEMLGISLLSILITIVVYYISARIGANFVKHLRKQLYDRIHDFSMEEINQFQTSSLITRSTNDITQVQMVVIVLLRLAFTAPIMAIRAIQKIVDIDLTLSMPIAVAIIVIVLMISVIFIFVTPLFSKVQNLTDDLNQVTRENLTGLRVVRAHNAEGYEHSKFKKVNNELTRMNLYVNRAMQMMMPGMMLVMNGVSLAVTWIAAVMIQEQTLGANPLEGIAIQSQFSIYGIRILFAFMTLTMLFIMVPRGAVSGKRIYEVLNTTPKIKDPENPKEIPADQAVEVEFNDVCFKYPLANECVLEHISFKAKAGQTVAFIGSTGSGKSTIINLIPRFYDVSSGAITLNGVDIRDVRQKDLLDYIGYIPQKGLLFSGDIASNLRVGKPDASEEDMQNALKTAQAYDFVMEKEGGLNADVAQGGKNFSGGQRQRLCIARAIIKQPKIYIFDDSFSALDYQTDRKLRAALKEQTKSSINFIVAQRIGTIMNADQIIVLDKGKAVGIGTHQELLANNKVYQEMAYSQLSKEELENASL